MQGYLWFPEFPKVEWEAEPLALKLLSCGTSSQTPSLLLRLGLKPSSLMKPIVSYSHVAIGLDCWGTPPDAPSPLPPLVPLSSPLTPHLCHHCRTVTLRPLFPAVVLFPLCAFLQVSLALELCVSSVQLLVLTNLPNAFAVASCCSFRFSLHSPQPVKADGRPP